MISWRPVDTKLACPTYVAGADNGIYVNGNNRYADDSQSGSYSAAVIQKKAELVSAYCIVFGLKLSSGKIRRLLQNFLPSNCHASAESMRVYTVGWIPTEVPIQTTGSSTYLGGIHDLDNTGSDTTEWLERNAQLLCQTVKYSRFSMATKIAVATSSIVHKIRYKAELSNQSLQDLAKVDAIFANTFLKTTNNMNSYPRRLLHLSRKRGGLGMPLFSETVVIGNLQKLSGCMRSF